MTYNNAEEIPASAFELVIPDVFLAHPSNDRHYWAPDVEVFDGWRIGATTPALRALAAFNTSVRNWGIEHDLTEHVAQHLVRVAQVAQRAYARAEARKQAT